MCCHGCEAVAQTIIDAGYTDFYRRRTDKPLAPAEPVPDFLEASAYDNPDVQAQFVSDRDHHDTSEGPDKQVSLIVNGITCAACAWLIESRLKQTPGITDVYVNYNTHRATLSWQPSRIRLSDIIERVRSIGYRARPFDPAVHEDLARREHRTFLLRIGITGALGMQVMMIATAMYFGESGGIEQGHRELFRWLSLFLTVPIVAYCAAPFFHGAHRDIRNGTLGMDVPVSLGLGIAFAGSVWGTWTGTGAVYYESVAMFVFLLLCARFLENRARHRSIASIEALGRSLPDLAERREPDGQWRPVLASALLQDDVVRVHPGNAFPADGCIVEGRTSANESLLTGESLPVDKAAGSEVLAGAINVEQPVVVQVSRGHAQSTVSQIIRMTEKAQSLKPGLARLADRAAAWFIGGVLLLAVGAGVYWYTQDTADWLAVVVSILVVTCPCALSLATPAALTAAVNALAERSVVPVNGTALETLARVDTIMLDKTGTLTEGRLSVDQVACYNGTTQDHVLEIAASLNQSSRHPVAAALRDAWAGPTPPVEAPHHEAGGVSGTVGDQLYFLGNAGYIAIRTGEAPRADSAKSCAWLATGDRILARIDLDDRVRSDARPLLAALREAGLSIRLCSGDHHAAVQSLADRLGIEHWQGDMTPLNKLDAVRALQQSGHVVAAVGDGTNDAPFLSAADVSMSMAGGTDLTRVSADMVLMSDALAAIPEAMRIARRTKAIIRQNIAWAVGYNLLALPAAVVGAVPPWLAAIGMSVSSLIVVTNALRVNLRRRETPDTPGPELATAAG